MKKDFIDNLKKLSDETEKIYDEWREIYNTALSETKDFGERQKVMEVDWVLDRLLDVVEGADELYRKFSK